MVFEQIFEKGFEVSSYCTDSLKRLNVEYLSKFFQEAAWMHAEELKVGFSDLGKTGKAWVLSRVTFQIKQLPLWGEKIVLKTWPSGVNSIFALRNFEFYNEENKTIIAGSSAWLIIDIASRKPQRVEPYITSVPIVDKDNYFQVRTEKIQDVKGVARIKLFESQYTDIDMNGHVNNTIYIRWIIDSYSFEFHSSHQLEKISLNYISETGVGEMIEILVHEISERQYWHSIRRKRDKVELCRAYTVWKKIAIF